MATYYSALQAAARLGVSRQTLYSYVSRGLLRAHPGDSYRERRYLIAEVNQLATRRSGARSPVRAARDALNWGLPVVESSKAEDLPQNTHKQPSPGLTDFTR
jgi:citrate synthase